MTTINHTHLAQLDLNLLVAFDALLTERHVTRAAARMRVGQSTMSHNLARLRELFRDELFVRAEGGMQPTPRAQALSAHVRAALAECEGAIDAALSKKGYERRVVLSTPHAMSVPFVLRRLRVIATLPRRAALVGAETLGLSTSPVPVALAGYSIAMLWHASYDHDPAHRWLHEMTARIAGEL